MQDCAVQFYFQICKMIVVAFISVCSCVFNPYKNAKKLILCVSPPDDRTTAQVKKNVSSVTKGVPRQGMNLDISKKR